MVCRIVAIHDIPMQQVRDSPTLNQAPVQLPLFLVPVTDLNCNQPIWSVPQVLQGALPFKQKVAMTGSLLNASNPGYIGVPQREV